MHRPLREDLIKSSKIYHDSNRLGHEIIQELAGPCTPFGGSGTIAEVPTIPVGNGADMVQRHRKSRGTRPLSEASLRRQFCLTPAEAQIALGLADGETLAAIAETRGVSVSTARGQLKSVFAKTGTHRQAELITLLIAPRNRFRRRRLY